MNRIFLLLFFTVTAFQSFSQNNWYDTVSTIYNTDQNPHYWKHDPPSECYWQQDVHYIIDARVDDSTNIIHGDHYKLKYWNNSPHEINELYFHLYQNAFQPGSHYHNLNENNRIEVEFGEYEQQGLGTTYENIRVNGRRVDTELDNTILRVSLNEPLQPGEQLEVTMNFKTYFDKGGSMRRRMKMFQEYGVNHYDGVHWYPSISVYDERFGWGTEQHLDKEFYSNYGQFDIRLTFPTEYIVEATGELMNEDEAMPAELKEQLMLKNFTDQPQGAEPSTIIEPTGEQRSWYYRAMNVHNFAFTADPLYRYDDGYWNDVLIRAVVREPHARGWRGAMNYTANVIKVYSEDFGEYDWPKVVIADAKDGMEYPMLTLDNGTYPGNQSLLSHEVGHMWFYGMLGTNETYRAMMDEGFTQFLTVWSMNRILGEQRRRSVKNQLVTKYLDPSDTRYERLYYPYIRHVLNNRDYQLNTHSSMFEGAIRHGGNYGLVYYKAGVMLYNLRYVLGDELFQDAMKYYVNKWKFAHPYPEDFRQAIIEYTQADLNWFFDQWIETEKYIDYSVDWVRQGDKPDEYRIHFTRKGRMQMPLEFTVTTRDSMQYDYYIPNTWFVKDTDAEVLPKWYGWDLLNPEYVAEIEIPGDILSVEIDPDHELADVYLVDNKKGGGGNSEWEPDLRVPNYPNWKKAQNYWRPDLWYNGYDGLKIGGHVEGNYMDVWDYSITAWGNTGLGQYDVPDELENSFQYASFDIDFRRRLWNVWRGLDWSGEAYWNAGIWNINTGLVKEFRKQDWTNEHYSRFFFNIKYLANDLSFREYLLYPNHWGQNMTERETWINSSVNFGFYRHYAYPQGSGEFTIGARVPAVYSDYRYSRINLESENTFRLAKLQFRSRVFGQLGFGDFPLESSLYLAMANPEEMIDNRLTRARGVIPASEVGFGAETGWFHYGGGLNLRGYTGYLAAEELETAGGDDIYYGYIGQSGASLNLEVEFDEYLKIKRPSKGLFRNLHLDTYLFSDIGILNTKVAPGETEFGKVRMDAGVGTALRISFGYFRVNPLVLRFDMPFFLNTPPANEDYLDLRWVFGIKRAF